MFLKKIKNKKQQEPKKFTFSENAITFIKSFIITELNITSPIDAEMLDSIIDLATQWEMDMIDPLNINGCDKTYEYKERQRNEMADNFVSEITGQWDDEKLIPDFNDLNKRLGLF